MEFSSEPAYKILKFILSWINLLLFVGKWAWDAFVHMDLHSNYRKKPCISLLFFFRYINE